MPCWVSIIEPNVLQAELELPSGVEPVAYLCVLIGGIRPLSAVRRVRVGRVAIEVSVHAQHEVLPRRHARIARRVESKPPGLGQLCRLNNVSG